MPNKVRVALTMLNLRQADLAEATGFTAPYISSIVNGDYKSLPVESARTIAQFFGCQIEDLFPAREAVAS